MEPSVDILNNIIVCKMRKCDGLCVEDRRKPSGAAFAKHTHTFILWMAEPTEYGKERSMRMEKENPKFVTWNELSRLAILKMQCWLETDGTTEHKQQIMRRTKDLWFGCTQTVVTHKSLAHSTQCDSVTEPESLCCGATTATNRSSSEFHIEMISKNTNLTLLQYAKKSQILHRNRFQSSRHYVKYFALVFRLIAHYLDVVLIINRMTCSMNMFS